MVHIPKLVSPAQSARTGIHIPHAGQHDKLVKESQRLVSQTFFGTLLRQMRDSPFKNDMLDGGQGGKMFAGLLDQHLADRMASGVGNKLVNAIVRKIEGASATQKSSEPRKKQAPPPAAMRGLYRRPSAASKHRSQHVPTDYRA